MRMAVQISDNLANQMVDGLIESVKSKIGEGVEGLLPVLTVYVGGPGIPEGTFEKRQINIEDAIGSDDRFEQLEQLGYSMVSKLHVVPFLAVLVSEAWAVKQDKDQGVPQGRPSQHPNRYEIFMASSLTLDGRAAAVSYGLTRDEDNNFVLGEREINLRFGDEDAGGMQNNLVGAFYDGAVKGIREVLDLRQ